MSTTTEKTEQRSAERRHDAPAKKSYLPDAHRLLPQSPEAEQGLLSSLLIAPWEVHGLCEEKGITADVFHIPAHQTVFQALETMIAEKLQIDIITLSQYLHDLNLLDSVGGAAFVTHLFTYLPTHANAAYYAEICVEKQLLRQVIKIGTEYAARGYEEQHRPDELLDEFQGRVMALDRPDGAQNTIQPISAVLDEAVKAIEETFRSRGGLIGLPSGFFAIDRMTRGARPGELWVIAGRPSMGKSAYLLNMAEHVALGPGKGTGKTVLIFTLEMPSRSLMERLLLARADIRVKAIRDGYMSKEQFYEVLPRERKKMDTGRMFFDETPGLSIQQLRSRARRFKRTHPDLAGIYVDYLQLATSTTVRAQGNRQLEIDEISEGLRRLAREMKIPVFAAAQLNRENDGPSQLPKLSNLRESGTIEQHADVVIALHRKWYYTKADEDLNKATGLLLKQRNGPTGDFPLVFLQDHARFENPPGEEFYSNDPAKRQGGQKEEE